MSDLHTKMPLIYEPKRQHRWIWRFPADLGIQEWTLKSAKRPSISNDAKAIEFFNTETYVAGRYKWEPIDITLRDAIAPSTTQACMEWIRLVSESATGRQGYAIGYKRDVEILLTDPSGVVVEKWILKNAFPTKYDGGNLDYGQDDLAEVTLSIQFDYAILCY